MSNAKTVLWTLLGIVVTLLVLIVGLLSYFRLTYSN
jgi:hypothetical protein